MISFKQNDQKESNIKIARNRVHNIKQKQIFFQVSTLH